MIDRIIKWQFCKIKLGKDLFHLGPDKLIKAIVIANMKETTAGQVFAQVTRLLVGENHISMPGHENKGIIKYFGATYFNDFVFSLKVGFQIFIAKLYQIG